MSNQSKSNPRWDTLHLPSKPDTLILYTLLHFPLDVLRTVSNQSAPNQQENRQRVLRQLELAIGGLSANDLSSPTRSLVQHDIVAMANGPWSRKDRCLFLFRLV